MNLKLRDATQKNRKEATKLTIRTSMKTSIKDSDFKLKTVPSSASTKSIKGNILKNLSKKIPTKGDVSRKLISGASSPKNHFSKASFVQAIEAKRATVESISYSAGLNFIERESTKDSGVTRTKKVRDNRYGQVQHLKKTPKKGHAKQLSFNNSIGSKESSVEPRGYNTASKWRLNLNSQLNMNSDVYLLVNNFYPNI